MTPPVKQMITTGRTQDAAPGTGEKFNTGYIWAVSLAGALGGLLFGYDWVVIGGAKPFYEKFRSARRSAWYRGKVQYRLYLGGFPGRSARGIAVRIRLGGYRWREAVLREVPICKTQRLVPGKSSIPAISGRFPWPERSGDWCSDTTGWLSVARSRSTRSSDLQDAAPGTGEKFNTGYIWAVSLAGALGGLVFGYDWVVIGGAKPFYEKFFRLAEGSQQGWAMSCALIGCLIGALVSGALSDRYGRKKALMLSAILFAVSSVLTGWASLFRWFVVWPRVRRRRR